MRYLTTVSNVWEENGQDFHYITILMGCGLSYEIEPKVMEPDKCEGWHWIDWEDMKKWAKGEYFNDEFEGDLFPPLQNLAMQAIREESIDPFDPIQAWNAAEDKAAILGDEEV